jgi:hypothetical protein
MSDDLTADEARYAEVVDYVPAAEREKLARLKAEREAGRPNYYGHDLYGAIRRGWRNRARQSCREAADSMVKSGWGRSPRARLTALLYCVIENAGEEGITEEEVRAALQRMLDANDSTRIAKLIERNAGE